MDIFSVDHKSFKEGGNVTAQEINKFKLMPDVFFSTYILINYIYYIFI